MVIRKPLMTWNNTKKKMKYLENPVFINGIGEDPNFSSHKRRQDVDGHKDGHAQPADAMQNIRQHRALPFISQGRSPG